jgi:hypothetical protein
MWLLTQTHNVTNVAVTGKYYKSERIALGVRAVLEEPHSHTHTVTTSYPYFLNGGCHILNSVFLC